RPAALDRSLERWEEHLTQYALRNRGGADVRAALGLTGTRHVLERGEDMIFCGGERRAFEAMHGRDAQLADEMRVFGVGLFEAAPTRIARDVDHRCEHDGGTARANLARDDREHAREQLRIPRARERNRLWEVSRAARRVAVQSFFMKQRRN